ncbi:hypothetical protein K492DRAFT_180214 [Lichtheimia hyalospora FSU 10163]|nr:hypothetical protein K492DRAFT_180214 [Lichtheimia hyalospora FSU 10163]
MTSALHWQQQHIHEPSPHQQQQHHHRHRAWEDDRFRDIPVEEEDEEEEEEEEEDEGMIIEDASSMSSSPSIPDENINFDLVYALHTFVATVEGQASVVKGDALILMEDTNIYWWLVEVLKTREVGYIPAENIEEFIRYSSTQTPYERLARLNKHRNVEITSPAATDDADPTPKFSSKNVTIAADEATRVIHYEVESEDEGDNDTDNDNDHDDDDDDDDFQDAHDSVDATDEITAAPEMASLTVPETGGGGEVHEPLRVFAGNIGQEAPLFHTFSIGLSTTADELVKDAVSRFALDLAATEGTIIEYYIAVQGLDGDDYVLSPQDKPLSIFKTLTAPLTTPMPSVSHIKQPQANTASGALGNAFTTNPTPIATTPSGKKKKLMASRQEIDRIDKIMPVKQDQQIGSVINMALEKFHVPDAEADGLPCSLGPTERCLTKYRMSVRAVNGVETPLDPRDHMASALHHQQQTSPVTSDLLFILRRADSLHYRKAQPHPPPLLSPIGKPGDFDNNSSIHGNDSTMIPEERRPSILDILMDSPRSADHRTGFLNSPMDDRRPSFPSSLSSQERKSSLTPYQGTSTVGNHGSLGDSWAPHSPSTSSLSPPTPGFRRTSVMSSSNISATSSVYSDYDNNITTTPDMKHSSTEPSARKKESSLKQQLKRLVGWGSKTKKNPPPPLQQQQQYHGSTASLGHPNTPATMVNDSSLSVKPIQNHASSSQVSVVSAPPTPLTPTPHSGQTKVQPKITSATAPSTPIASNTPFSPVKANTPDQQPIVNESAVSAVTTSSTSSLSSDDDDDDIDVKEPIELSDDSSSEDEDEDEDDDGLSTMSRNKALPNKPGENNEIQAQYTMWMDSQQGDDDTPKRESKTEFVEPPLPPLPGESSHSSPSSTSSPPAVADGSSTLSPPSSLSSCSTTPSQQQQQASSTKGGDGEGNGLDDLFLLVTRGVDYLQSRESSKWDDEGGYDFHPWNRPDGSFVIRKKPEPPQPTLTSSSSQSNNNEQPADHHATDSITSLSQHEDSSSTTTSTHDQVPPARSNSTSSNKVTKAPSVHHQRQAPPPSSASGAPAQQNEALIDEQELQRIVAAHIVF